MPSEGLLGLVPGVYVKEVNTGSRPILGVGTSTAGFIGYLNKAPSLSKPNADGQLVMPKNVTTFEAFKAAFTSKPVKDAPPIDDPEILEDADSQILIEAIKGYFANGGSTCYVLPVNSLKGKTSSPNPTPAENNDDQVIIALKRFEAIEDVSILAIPVPSSVGLTVATEQLKRRAEIRQKLIEHCNVMQDRFAVLDGEENGIDPQTSEPTLELVYPQVDNEGKILGRGPSTGQAAVYYPWLFVSGRDKKPVPPSGHIAGLYARVDAERGVFKAPANEFLYGATGLAVRVTPKQQSLLNPDGVNVIRIMDGSQKVYGARTIKTKTKDGTALEYVSTRRYLNFLRKSIEKGTEFVVFEPNSIALWQRVVRTVGDFLYNQWNAGGLFGATPKEAFFVRCDQAINPEIEREAGKLNIDVGVSIVKPAEFVIFRLSQQVPPA